MADEQKIREAGKAALDEWAKEKILPPQKSVRRGYLRGFQDGAAYQAAQPVQVNDELVERVKTAICFTANGRDVCNCLTEISKAAIEAMGQRREA